MREISVGLADIKTWGKQSSVIRVRACACTIRGSHVPSMAVCEWVGGSGVRLHRGKHEADS